MEEVRGADAAPGLLLVVQEVQTHHQHTCAPQRRRSANEWSSSTRSPPTHRCSPFLGPSATAVCAAHRPASVATTQDSPANAQACAHVEHATRFPHATNTRPEPGAPNDRAVRPPRSLTGFTSRQICACAQQTRTHWRTRFALARSLLPLTHATPITLSTKKRKNHRARPRSRNTNQPRSPSSPGSSSSLPPTLRPFSSPVLGPFLPTSSQHRRTSAPHSSPHVSHAAKPPLSSLEPHRALATPSASSSHSPPHAHPLEPAPDIPLDEDDDDEPDPTPPDPPPESAASDGNADGGGTRADSGPAPPPPRLGKPMLTPPIPTPPAPAPIPPTPPAPIPPPPPDPDAPPSGFIIADGNPRPSGDADPSG